MDEWHFKETGDRHVILGTRSQINYKFHSKGQHFVNTTSPENLRIQFQIVMAPSSRQLLNSWISSYILYSLNLLPNLYNLLNPTNYTSLIITQHESPPNQSQENNAGLCTKMSMSNAVTVRARRKKCEGSGYCFSLRLPIIIHFEM